MQRISETQTLDSIQRHFHSAVLNFKQSEVMFVTDSLLTVMTGLGDCSVDGKYFEKAALGAEDVCESLLLVSCLALHHALLAVGAYHLHCLICKIKKKTPALKEASDDFIIKMLAKC